MAQEIQGDPIDSAETMQLMGIRSVEFMDIRDFEKMKEVCEFFKGAPDKSFVLRKITDGKVRPDGDIVSHVWQYVQLRKQNDVIGGELKAAEDQYKNLASRRNSIIREIGIFER